MFDVVVCFIFTIIILSHSIGFINFRLPRCYSYLTTWQIYSHNFILKGFMGVAYLLHSEIYSPMAYASSIYCLMHYFHLMFEWKLVSNRNKEKQK